MTGRRPPRTAPASILDEHRSRPGLLLALLGHEAMRRVRAAHTAHGLVSRVRDRADRRRHLVTLTPAGERALDSASRAQKETEDELFASLDDEQREQLGALLVALRDGLAADNESACKEAAEAGPEAER